MSTIKVVQGNIAELNIECIVNSAKKTLGDGGGVCGAIYSAAGRFRLKLECSKLKGCEVGQAKITPGLKLHAKYIIHTVGPKLRDSGDVERKLIDCYINSLDLAKEYNIKEIAFPIISTGVHHFPLDKGVDIAVTAVEDWIDLNPDYKLDIVFCVDNSVSYDYCKDRVDKWNKPMIINK